MQTFGFITSMLYHRAIDTRYGGMNKKGDEFLLSTACTRNPAMTSSSLYRPYLSVCLFICLLPFYFN